MEIATILDPARTATYEEQGLWPGLTLFDAFETVLEHSPSKTLVVAGEKRWSYSDVAAKVDALARSMAALGIGRGDVVSIQLPNWAEFIVIHLAATRLGAITNTLLPIYRAKELRYILSFARSKLLFIPSIFRRFNYLELHRDLRSDLPNLNHICVVGGGCPDDMLDFDVLTRPLDSEPLPPAISDGNDITILIFTSGTEASPKGVVHSHNSLMFGNQSAKKILGLTSEEVVWSVSPISHATGIEWGVRQAIVLGATIVLQDVWDTEQALDLIERERCTFTTAAANFATMLLESLTLEQRDLSSFRLFLCGGAAIPSALGTEMMERTGCNLIPCWGMSECFAATMGSPNDPDVLRWGTDGRALPGSETAIFDETRSRQLAAGEIGEVATRGPHVCLGYFNDPERTAETFSEGWLFSNDLGTIDSGGNLRIVGRKKDIINRGGLKISASEVEELLLRHPGIRAAALIGLPDTRLGERACACIVPEPGVHISLPELVRWLKLMGVSDYKLPEFLSLIDELPMTPTGKVQKFKLRDALLSGDLAKTAA